VGEGLVTAPRRSRGNFRSGFWGARTFPDILWLVGSEEPLS